MLHEKSVNIFMLGDSHVQQLFESLLCIFSFRARDVIVYERYEKDSGKPLELNYYWRTIYDKYENVPACHTISYKEYPNYYISLPLVKGDLKSQVDCTISHFPGAVSCFKIDSRSANLSQICLAYVRPALGMNAVQAGLNTSLRLINSSVDAFDVLIVNTYISVNDLKTYLSQVDYSGRVIVIPKYSFGYQKNVVHNEDILTTKYDENELKNSEVSLSQYCQKLSAKARFDLIKFDFSKLVFQRSDDSKASIYPFSYSVHNNRSSNNSDVIMQVCQEEQRSPNNCAGKDYRVCTSDCERESHFCLPGPTDELGLLLLGASMPQASQDYNYSSLISVENGSVYGDDNWFNGTNYKMEDMMKGKIENAYVFILAAMICLFASSLVFFRWLRRLNKSTYQEKEPSIEMNADT
jgi:hypothetical protein